MSLRIVVTGTDTGVGKTVFSAALAGALGASYWKPVQSGLEPESDSETVRTLGSLPPERILPEAWRLRMPVSPHAAAEMDGVTLRPEALQLPVTTTSLVIEGTGGLLVPLTRLSLFADVFARWRLPAIVCARTSLGTINHTLLTLAVMRQRRIPVLGIAFIGDTQPDTERTICEMGSALRLGRLPFLDPLTPQALSSAFREHFDLALIQRGMA